MNLESAMLTVKLEGLEIRLNLRLIVILFLIVTL